MSLRILHFSDLHLVKDEQSMKTLLMYFIQSMDEIQKDGNIDLVVFTGDLVDKGGYSFGNIDAAFKDFEKVVITPIIEKLKLPKERFVFIPGNHDTENGNDKQYMKRGFLDSNPHDDYEKIISIKNSPKDQDVVKARTKAFKNFEKSYYADILKEGYKYGDFESNFKFDIKGCKIGITSLNSVWLCGLDDDKELFLGADQVTNSQLFLSKCDIKIVASHIGYDLLTEAESKYTKNSIIQCYDLNLSGHTHSLDDGFTASPSGYFCMNITSAGTLYNNIHKVNEEYKNSFQVIDLISNSEFYIRKYYQKQGMEFILDKNFGNDGIWNFKYNSQEAIGRAKTDVLKEQLEQQRKFLENVFPFCTIDEAIEQDKETFMSGEFIPSQTNEKCINLLRNPEIKNLRILSISGVGKTRIVGEAFRTMQNVFYCTDPDKRINRGLEYILTHVDGGVIIIDNCPIDEYYRVTKFISKFQKPFKLISIYNVLTKKEEVETNVFFLDAADNKGVVDTIIERERITDETVKSKIKEYSDGISLMAIELIKAYKHIGKVQLLPEKQLWLDYLLSPNGQLEESKRAVLNAIALFNPLGITENKKDEYDFVISHPEINHIHLDKSSVEDCFSCTIHEFNQRRLLDMRANSVNVRPRPLAEWLAEEWLQKTPPESWEKIVTEIETAGQLGIRLAEQMKNRFLSLTSPEAQRLFDELNRIPFHDEKIVLTKTGSQLIFSMSTVSHMAVARNLFSLFENKTTDYLKEKISGDIRRYIVWALEEACVAADAFEDAGKLLGMLSIAENEQISNNASGVFLEKFHVVLSGTQADLGKKRNVLQFLFDKGTEYHLLLVKAIGSAFSTRSNYHMLTQTERKYNIKPEASISISELRRYWRFCKEMLIKVSDNDDLLKNIQTLIPEHTYDLVNNGCEDLLFELIDYFAPKYNNDWDEMRRSLNWIKKYNPEAYERNKQHIDLLINDVFAPKTFIKRVLVAMENIDRREFGSDRIFDVYKSAMRPYGEEFINNKIYNSEEFGEIADNDHLQSTWMIFTAVKVMDQAGCRDEVYEAFMHHIISKNKDYRSSFIESYMSHDPNKPYLLSIAEKMFCNGYYAMACCVLGMVEDKNYTQLNKIFVMIHERKFPSTYINNYLRFVPCCDMDDIFKVSALLFNNADVDKTEVAYPHLFQYFWTMGQEVVPYLPIIEKRLLEFDFESNKFYLAKDVVDKMEYILKTFNRPDFARQVNNLVIKYLETYKHNNPFKDLYFSLLPKYQENILDDIIKALASSLEESMFYFNMRYELGSGFGYGAGPLFQCNNDKLKNACKEFSDILPERFADMCPVCNFRDDGAQMEFSDFFVWLADNYGDNEKVLQSFSSNFGTYSYTGIGSMKGYYVNRKNMFKPLFSHPNPKVAAWAENMYKMEEQEVNYQQLLDDYRDMTKG
jgi:predicted MPP superfamily phosphohydrolase